MAVVVFSVLVPLRNVVLCAVFADSYCSVPVSTPSRGSGCGPPPLVLNTRPEDPAPDPPEPFAVPPGPPPPLIVELDPPSVLDTIPEFTPRRLEPALARRMSVSAMSRLMRAIAMS